MALRREELKIQPIDLEEDIAVGIKLPFATKAGGLFELSYTTEDQGLSNLKNLLLTRKKERYLQPNFGTALYETLFEQIDEDSPDRLRQSLVDDINYWLPYILLDDISIDVDNSSAIGMIGHGYKIKILFRVTENGANQTITLNISANGVPTLE